MDYLGLLILVLLGLFVCVVVLPLLAISRAGQALEKVRELEAQVRRLNYLLQRAQENTPGATEPPTQEAPSTPPAPEPPAPQPAAVAQSRTSFSPPPPTPSTPPAVPAPDGRSATEWELLIGRSVFNRVGAVALLISVAFLLKYAFDHNWIGTWMLVTAGFVFGGGLVALGNRMNRAGAQVFAQGVLGVGISVLYLTVYASFNLYHLVPQTGALALMCAVTVIAFQQAIEVDSLAVSILALIGGFLTPVLLGGGEGASGSGLGLFAYLVVLDAGLLAVTLKKDSWAVIEPLTLAGTYAVYAGWRAQNPDPSTALVTGSLAAVWALFYGLDLHRTIRGTNGFADQRAATAVANSLVFYGALYFELQGRHQTWLGPATLMIAVAYFGALVIVVRGRPDAATALPRYAVTAIVLLVVATAVQFHANTFALVSLWAAEATALIWSGLHWRMRYVWGCAVGLLAVAASLLLTDEHALSSARYGHFVPILNSRFTVFGILAAACAACALLFEGSEDDLRHEMAGALHLGWSAVLFALITVEIKDYFAAWSGQGIGGIGAGALRFMVMAAAWAMYSIAVLLVGLRKGYGVLTASAFAWLAAGVGAVGIQGADLRPDPPVLLNARAAAFLVVVTCMAAHKSLIRRSGLDWAETGVTVFRVAISLFVFELVSLETWDAFSREAGARAASANLRQMALSVAWVGYSVILMIYGFWRRVTPIRLVAIGLFEITILKVFLYDLSCLDTLSRVFSFMALGFILLGTSYLYQKYKNLILGTDAG